MATILIYAPPDEKGREHAVASIKVNHGFLSRFFMIGSMSFEDLEIVESPTVSAAIEWVEAILKNNQKNSTFSDKWGMKAKEQAEKKVLPFLKKHDKTLTIGIYT